MKNSAGVTFWVLIVLGLSSCSMPPSVSSSNAVEEVKEQYSTISAILTETAVITVVPTQTRMATSTPSYLPTLTRTPGSFTAPLPTVAVSYTATSPEKIETARTPVIRCEIAQAGRPIDVTIPDETRLYPGESFSKTWRLVNAGNCSWDSDYAVVWFSGDDMGTSAVQSLSEVVHPGQVVDVTVDMVAPEVPGTYQSNWKIRGPENSLFGIGPNGDAPFWVRIVVVPVATLTATPTLPTPTQTPAIFASGSLTLALEDRIDLDIGGVNQGEKDDFVFARSDEDSLQLIPASDSRIALFGMIAPELVDCLLVEVSSEPLDLEDLPAGAYLCYRTHEGLPGWLTITELSTERARLSLDFLTWGIP